MMSIRDFKLVLFDFDNETNTTGQQVFYHDPTRGLFVQCHKIDNIITNYVYPIIGVIGFILNVLCVLIFSDRKFCNTSSRSNIFSYLLIKSVFDCLILLLKAFNPIFSCDVCQFHATYLSKIFELVLYKYFIYVCTLCSIVFELIAQLDRLVAISLPINKRSMPNYKLPSFFIILFIVSFYSFKLFEYKIESDEHDDKLIYNLYKTDFSMTTADYVLNLTQSFIRDFICVLLLILLDIAIVVVFRRIMVNKKHIITGSLKRKKLSKELTVNTVTTALIRTSSLKTKTTMQKLQNAENKTTLMIIIIGVMTLIGRLPIFVKYLPLTWDIKQCVGFTSETLFFFVLSLNFFVYYKFNPTFKTVFGELFLVELLFSKSTTGDDMTLDHHATLVTARSPCCKPKFGGKDKKRDLTENIPMVSNQQINIRLNNINEDCV